MTVKHEEPQRSESLLSVYSSLQPTLLCFFRHLLKFFFSFSTIIRLGSYSTFVTLSSKMPVKVQDHLNNKCRKFGDCMSLYVFHFHVDKVSPQTYKHPPPAKVFFQ